MWCGGGVARLTGVDDDHGAALASELEGGRQPGGRSADDGDVAASLDGGGGVVTHELDDTVTTRKVHVRLQYSQDTGGTMATLDEIEHVVRSRLRSLHTTFGLSLDELAPRASLSPSTISRVETGKRTISLDVLLPLAAALQVDLDALLDVDATTTTW